MKNITIIEGEDLDHLLAQLDRGAEDVWRIRVWQSPDGSGAKFAINSGMWTPALGERAEQ